MSRQRPTDPALDSELARGLSFHRAGQALSAEATYRAVLERAPDHPHALNYLGTLLAAGSRSEEGIELLRRSVRQAPGVPEFQLNLADALMATGRADIAESVLKRALQIRRGADVLAKLGLALMHQGKLKPATHQLDQALALAPQAVDVRCNLATLRAQAGEADAARSLLASALALVPSHLDSLNARAVVEQNHGDLPSAATWCRRTLAVSASFAPAHGNLSAVLSALAQRAASARHARLALALSPGAHGTWSNIGNLMQANGWPAEAEIFLRRATRLAPDYAVAWSNLGRTLNAQARFPEAIAAYRRSLDLDPLYAPAYSNLLFLSHFDPSFSSEQIFEEHVAFGRRHESAARRDRRPHANTREPERRLRIGYVSADFGRHPAGYFLKPVILNHDPAAVDVLCFSDRTVEDDMTELFRNASSAFRRTIGMTDARLAELIREDRIDVLIDLSGHTGGNRLPLFARKPAPVQVSWLGYYDTTGLESIDAVLADPWEVEPGDERWYVEKVIRLPTGRLCYSPPTEAPEVTPLPMTARGSVTFGCFNHVAKLTDATLGAWSRILAAVPGSRLVLRSPPLADPSYRASFFERCRRLGLAPHRLDMAAATPTQILTEYGMIDLALDPFPFPGGLTTCESLWMGVPVVTLKGRHPVTRQSVSFLARVGHAELITTSVDAYVDLVVSLARAPERLAAIRGGPRAKMAASPLTDGAGAARAIEAALRQLWKSWCSAGR
ncbi:MAG: tetratricopeptide repeat protein [Alphaproteobacteria bacterium]|nr:tetratricopeptide repeat protein [Alphaproteobacteria bacterium]